jgi:hypothetical protein
MPYKVTPDTNLPISKVPNSIQNAAVIKSSQNKEDVPEFDFNTELKNSGHFLKEGKPTSQLVKEAAEESMTGINPKLLFANAWIEGMNKAVINNIDAPGGSNKDLNYPVSGFGFYGVDTFMDKYDKIKKYLPAGFKSKFKPSVRVNELKQNVNSADFKTHKDALIAQAAMLKYEQDNVKNYAKSRGINLDEDALDYFTMASFNGGFGAGRKMLDEYSASNNKKAFITNGLTSKKQIHKNVMRRMNIRQTADDLIQHPPPPRDENEIHVFKLHKG